ncbi:MAG: tRNA threonylcarbamoyladenosine biosynthesis protein RimN [Halioglobus sp.]|nr:tRNA threonylcarbamoyladenosine biosynthesis protein RimN [Halioglobus sp.]
MRQWPRPCATNARPTPRQFTKKTLRCRKSSRAEVPAPYQYDLDAAVAALGRGAVLACPTEAVWGLSCDPFDESAVTRLLQLKQRPVEKGLILVAADESQLDALLTHLDPEQRETLSSSWPGPNTWLVPHGGAVPAWISGEHATVAVRVTAHEGMAALCRGFGGPLVSTSANPGGEPPATDADQVLRYFEDTLDGWLPGELGDSSRPSTIRDLSSGQVIRA